jgi:hypothetical protein
VRAEPAPEIDQGVQTRVQRQHDDGEAGTDNKIGRDEDAKDQSR